MKTWIIPIVTGAVSSVLASLIYAWLSRTNLSTTLIIVVIGASSIVISTGLYSLPRFRLAIFSGITAYYPNGQVQYIDTLLEDAKRSKTMIVSGARGLDIIGERSPIGTFLQEVQWQGSLEVFLLDPESKYARLRINSLDAEKEKYKAESHSVNKFIDVLSVRYPIQVVKYNYDADPIIRAVVLDECAYISFYQAGIRGRKLPCFRIDSKNNPLYKALLQYYQYLRTMSSLPQKETKHESHLA